jgi:hypothetical protein
MDIKPLGSVPSRRGPADSFTGTVWQDPIIEAPSCASSRAHAPHGIPTRSAKRCT